MVFGIADGVGGWNKSGVDPSLFAWDLMNSCKEASEYLEDWPDPKTILIDGYDTVVRKKEVKAGSSTACILTLDKVKMIFFFFFFFFFCIYIILFFLKKKKFFFFLKFIII